LPKFIISLLATFLQSLYLLKKNKITQIISMGGLVSIPVCVAGKILCIPITLYELNVEPGKTINLLSSLTNNINICFSATQKYFPKTKCNLVSYPVRFDDSIKNITQAAAIEKIKFNTQLKTILILGGSQGSLFLNDLIKNFVLTNRNIKIQVIHQTGPSTSLPAVAKGYGGHGRMRNDNFDWKNFYKELNIPAITFEYHHEPEYFYIASDLIICRAGAGTLAEVLFFEKKCITIPLETSYTSHQKHNALELAKEYPNLIHVIEQNKINNLDITKLI
jgi:UDP-N-acetylglucosamine--N-acetylmuramyl-(pentapeptide) pyrophosphoryl-undecaprenol N-acetylglucosamine transferase